MSDKQSKPDGFRALPRRFAALDPITFDHLLNGRFHIDAVDASGRYIPPAGQGRVYVFARTHINVKIFCEQYGVKPARTLFIDRVEKVVGLRRVEVVNFAWEGDVPHHIDVYEEILRSFKDGLIYLKSLPWKRKESENEPGST